MTTETELGDLRERIARTTVEIIRAAGERNRLALSAGKVKESAAMPLLDQGVEDSLVRQVIQECEAAGVSRSAGLKILNVLLTESKRVQGVKTGTSGTPMEALAKAVAMQKTGRRVLRLDVGEPDFPPPKAVLKACSDALFALKTHYTASRGIPELVSALRAYLKQTQGYDAKEDELLITTSGRFAVYASLASVVGEGESAIVIDPTWPAHRQVFASMGARPIVVHTTLEDGWEPTVEAIDGAIRPNTKAIVVSYPNNPTGKIIGAKKFNAIVSLANDRGLTVISDEAYSGYAFKECPSVLSSGAKSFILDGTFSKTWAMTGFRVGYAVSSKALVDRMLGMVSLMLTSVPEFIQHAAVKALGCDDEAEENRSTMKRRAEAVSAELDKIGSLSYYRPDGAMYVFPCANAGDPQAGTFADRLLQQQAVSVTPGSAFGNYPAFFRLSLGQPEDVLVEAVRKIGEALD